MKKIKVRQLGIAAILLLAAGACNQPKVNNEKVRVLEYQGYTVSRQMGINDVYDTTFSYRTININDSTISIFKTGNRLSVDDVVKVGCTRCHEKQMMP